MCLPDPLYDLAKWVVLIFLPALAVFVAGLGEAYPGYDTGHLVTLINLFTVFLGSILQISSNHYHQGGSDDDYGPPALV